VTREEGEEVDLGIGGGGVAGEVLFEEAGMGRGRFSW
jgi:hypothetical protein